MESPESNSIIAHIDLSKPKGALSTFFKSLSHSNSNTLMKKHTFDHTNTSFSKGILNRQDTRNLPIYEKTSFSEYRSISKTSYQDQANRKFSSSIGKSPLKRLDLDTLYQTCTKTNNLRKCSSYKSYTDIFKEKKLHVDQEFQSTKQQILKSFIEKKPKTPRNTKTFLKPCTNLSKVSNPMIKGKSIKAVELIFKNRYKLKENLLKTEESQGLNERSTSGNGYGVFKEVKINKARKPSIDSQSHKQSKPLNNKLFIFPKSKSLITPSHERIPSRKALSKPPNHMTSFKVLKQTEAYASKLIEEKNKRLEQILYSGNPSRHPSTDLLKPNSIYSTKYKN